VRVYLAPGWRGNQETIAPWVAGLRARGFEAEALLPGTGRAEQRTGAFLAVAAPDAVIGGISFGGRVASLVAAERVVAGLLCISYPLAGEADARTRHWPRISCPSLLVNGDQDELTDVAELRNRLPTLRRGRLEVIVGGSHSLTPELDQALDLAATFLASL
jgi:predicted alpha/beta-hydrolase family hydrolase